MSWGNTYPSRLTKAQANQNKCARCIFFSHRRESSAPYFKLLDILRIENIFKLKISLLTHKISQNVGYIPDVFQNYLVKMMFTHAITDMPQILIFIYHVQRQIIVNTHLGLP